MGFILDGLDSEAYDRSYTDRDLLRRVAAYFWPYRRQMLLVAGAIALNSITGIGGPILIAAALTPSRAARRRRPSCCSAPGSSCSARRPGASISSSSGSRRGWWETWC